MIHTEKLWRFYQRGPREVRARPARGTAPAGGWETEGSAAVKKPVGKPASRKRGFDPVRVLALMLFAAAVVRVIFLLQLERYEMGADLSLDSLLYYDIARTVVEGNALPAGTSSFNPLYPLFLVAVFKLFGVGFLAPRIIQLAIGLGTIALIFAAGRRLAPIPERGTRRGAVLAAAAAAIAILYARLMLYEGMLIATTLEVSFLAASLALALALDEDLRGERPMALGRRRVPQWLSSLSLGALCGAGALGRPNLFLLLIAALSLWLLAGTGSRRRGLALAASFVAGAAILLAPPIVHTAVTTGRIVPVTAGGGANFYIGNRTGSNGLFLAPEGVRGNVRGMMEDMTADAEAETGRSMTPPEVSSHYFRKTLQDMGRDPGAWLRVAGMKLFLFFNAEIRDLPEAFLYERSCGVLKLLFLPFSVISTLGACGFALLMMSGRKRAVVSIFLGCAVLSVVLFFVNERYRFPAVPILILLAAFAIDWAARAITRRQVKRVAVMLIAATAFFALVPGRSVVKPTRSSEYAALGRYYAKHNDRARAAEAFAEAYRLAPDKTEAIINYARVLREGGNYGRSADLYARAYARTPQYPLLAAEYGYVLERLGRRKEAKDLYREAAASNRRNEQVLACRLLAEALVAEGKNDEALLWVKKALEMIPGEPELTRMLDRLQKEP